MRWSQWCMSLANGFIARVGKGGPASTANTTPVPPIEIARESVDTVTMQFLGHPRRWLTGLIATLVATATISIAIGAQSPPVPFSIVYDTVETTHWLLSPSSGTPLSPSRGVYRQDLAGDGLFAAPYRIAKISSASLMHLSAPAIAQMIRAQITVGTYGSLAHIVTIDEIGVGFSEPGPANPRRGSRLPAINPSSIAARFSTAMQLLNTSQSPWGGTWASRVQVYVTNGVVGSIARGLGPLHNLDRLGRPRYPSWRAVMPGLALAGGIHLEMYHLGTSGIMPIPAIQWRQTPAAFVALLKRYGGSAQRVHWMFTSTTMPPGAPSGCGDPMTCSWALAGATVLGRTFLHNGPDAYNLGMYAPQWLQQFNLMFP